MTEIRELDERTVERIAAGEVVERPASVVKELVENALDAGAGRIEVAVADGGRESIHVSDDGRGMDRTAVERAVEQHTTSKLADVADLERGVGTLGFRGEALHAIGAVSRLTITTRPLKGDGAGTELTVEGGDVTGVEPAGRPPGTTVEVRDLFYNVPARRKYLKQAATEFAHVNRVVTSYALANPGVAVSLTHDGRETFATTGGDDLREAVMSVYGREVAAAMIPVSAGDGAGPLDGLSGLVSHPETNRAGREYLSTFVNGRYVTANAVRDAVVDAYGDQLASERYPFAVLFLSVDPASVDVNVHPRKLEVRFADREGVCEQVRTAIEDALREEGILRSSAPRGRSAPDQATIEPSTSDGSDESDADDETSGTAGNATAVESGDAGEPSTAPDAGGSRTTGDGESSPSAPSQARQSESPVTGESGTQTTLDGDDAQPSAAYDSLPDLRVLGQLQDTYVVAEAEDGLVLVDQHAADERINYEELKARFGGDTTTQVLADPVRLELTAGEAALFDTYRSALARLGFRASRVGDRTVEVTTVPAVVADAAGPALVREVIGDMVSGEDAAERTVEAVADDLLADMACYPSITGNTSLTEGSVVDLLSALDDCDNPWACPHGRPVLIHIDAEELDDRFERDYPGHDGRGRR
ncbi:MAG: DNA mismatch repair endonuclease MutL [Salinirussus sp.]